MGGGDGGEKLPADVRTPYELEDYLAALIEQGYKVLSTQDGLPTQYLALRGGEGNEPDSVVFAEQKGPLPGLYTVSEEHLVTAAVRKRRLWHIPLPPREEACDVPGVQTGYRVRLRHPTEEGEGSLTRRLDNPWGERYVRGLASVGIASS